MNFGAMARHLGVLVFAASLAACGGGGGFGPGSSPSEPQGGHGAPALSAISLVDPSQSPPNADYGTSTQPILSNAPATVQVTLLDAAGNVIKNAVVNFTLSSTVGSLGSSSALTDANGLATVTLSAGTVQGAGTLNASYTDADNQTATSEKSFAVAVSGSGPRLSTPALRDASNAVVGTTTNPVSDSNPATVTVTLSGVPDPANKLISFTMAGPSGVGQLDPATGTALTDGSGVATITLESGSQAGAATLRAVYSEGSASADSQTDFTTQGAGQVAALTLALGSGNGTTFQSGNIDPPPTGLVSGSSASVSVNVVDTSTNDLYTGGPVQVSFTSQCLQSGLATLSPLQAATIGGTATTSYTPKNGCTQDKISATATVNGKTLTAVTPQFAVTQSPANSISFVSASPATIGVKGSSAAGVKESSTLTFLIADQNGNPVGAGVDVAFDVQTPKGGFGIASGSASTVSTSKGSTDGNGDVTVIVNSGTVPMVGTVKASLTSDSSIFGTGSVSVQQGVATEDRFVIAVETLNPAAGNHVGVTDKVTVRAADRYGNWVPDGTRINFATKLGDIGPSCTTSDGTCSVTWASDGPQPLNFDLDRATDSPCPASFDATDAYRHGLPPSPWDLGCGEHDRYGVNVITAWTTGEESFSDKNGDNVFDNGEPFVDLGEAFDDNNINGKHDATVGSFSEDYQDLNANGQYDTGNGKYNGLSCDPTTNTQCDNSLIDVRHAATMVLSTDDIQMGVWAGDTAPGDLAVSTPTRWGTGNLTSATSQATTVPAGSTPFDVTVVVADLNGNAPPIGTKVSVATTPVTGATDQPKILGPSSCTVANSTDPLECTFDLLPGTSGNTFTITATSGAPGSPITVSDTLTVH